MTYNEANKLAERLTREVGNYVQVDENDDTLCIEGWVKFSEVKWLAEQLPASEEEIRDDDNNDH